jgi:hypothetical protein
MDTYALILLDRAKQHNGLILGLKIDYHVLFFAYLKNGGGQKQTLCVTLRRRGKNILLVKKMDCVAGKKMLVICLVMLLC